MERERESYAKRSCVDLKRVVMGRAPWCKNYTAVPLPCVLDVGWVGFRPPTSDGSVSSLALCSHTNIQ
jgi:hypothetical protein